MTQSAHFIGIGGTGLSAIARLLAERGWQVSGSDRSTSPYLQELEEMGVRITIGHSPDNISDVDYVIRSSAIQDDNIEVTAAREKGLLVQKRVDFLPMVIGEQSCIAVAGTHGKTTTTAMIAWTLQQAGMDPSFIIGSVSKNLGTNAHSGKGDYFVIEADEYDSMFLGLNPLIAIVTNVEHDHPDCYPTPQSYFQAFQNFIGKLQPRGMVILCADNPGAMSIRGKLSPNLPVFTYSSYLLQDDHPNSYQQNADYLLTESDDHTYQLCSQEALHVRKPLLSINVGVPGTHNLQNGMAASIAALTTGVEPDIINKALASFKGTGRRFDVIGEPDGITLVDDYAHHPTEIRATIQAARVAYPGRRLWVVWQPHTYSRTQTLLDDYIRAISQADQIVVTEIFAAREESTGFSSAQIVSAIHEIPAFYASTLDSAIDHLRQNLVFGDVVLVLSAGDATKINQALLHSSDIGKNGKIA